MKRFISIILIVSGFILIVPNGVSSEATVEDVNTKVKSLQRSVTELWNYVHQLKTAVTEDIYNLEHRLKENVDEHHHAGSKDVHGHTDDHHDHPENTHHHHSTSMSHSDPHHSVGHHSDSHFSEDDHSHNHSGHDDYHHSGNEHKHSSHEDGHYSGHGNEMGHHSGDDHGHDNHSGHRNEKGHHHSSDDHDHSSSGHGYDHTHDHSSGHGDEHTHDDHSSSGHGNEHGHDDHSSSGHGNEHGHDDHSSSGHGNDHAHDHSSSGHGNDHTHEHSSEHGEEHKHYSKNSTRNDNHNEVYHKDNDIPSSNRKLLPKSAETKNQHITALCDVHPNSALNISQRQNVHGFIFLWQKKSDGPLNVYARISGFKTEDRNPDKSAEESTSSNLHGFHVHTYGNLSKSCQSTGPHFNPQNSTHGGPNTSVKHAGDFGNIESDSEGFVDVTFIAKDASLTGSDSIIGKSLAVHAGQDDYGFGSNDESLKTGNAGPRIACCIIREVDHVPRKVHLYYKYSRRRNF